jgi:hypothetical protein
MQLEERGARTFYTTNRGLPFSDVEACSSLSVFERVVDFGLLEQELHDVRTAKRSCEVEGGRS